MSPPTSPHPQAQANAPSGIFMATCNTRLPPAGCPTPSQDGFPFYGQLGPGGVEMKVSRVRRITGTSYTGCLGTAVQMYALKCRLNGTGFSPLQRQQCPLVVDYAQTAHGMPSARAPRKVRTRRLLFGGHMIGRRRPLNRTCTQRLVDLTPHSNIIQVCGFDGADETYCLDSCSGYEGEIEEDDFTYRYYTVSKNLFIASPQNNSNTTFCTDGHTIEISCFLFSANPTKSHRPLLPNTRIFFSRWCMPNTRACVREQSCGFNESFYPFTALCYRGCCPDGVK